VFSALCSAAFNRRLKQFAAPANSWAVLSKSAVLRVVHDANWSMRIVQFAAG
jgi:hypothetical protein